jgi:hypothetical protein
VDRLSHLLRQAGERGKTDKHRLMCHAAGRLAEVEHSLAVISLALERGDMGVVRLRLQLIEILLGREQVVMDDADNEAGE